MEGIMSMLQSILKESEKRILLIAEEVLVEFLDNV